VVKWRRISEEKEVNSIVYFYIVNATAGSLKNSLVGNFYALHPEAHATIGRV
jgi:hypothetical protein